MNSDVRKVMELVCAALPPQTPVDEPDFHDISLTESDFKRQGLSIDGGVAALKYIRLNNLYGIMEISDIYAATVEKGDDPSLDGEHLVWVTVHSSIASALYSGDEKRKKPSFSFKDSVLTVDGREISFGSMDSKENGAYVLEHLFSHDLQEPSDYRDIHTEALGASKEDSYSGKRYYDACNVIQKRVSKVTGFSDFSSF